MVSSTVFHGSKVIGMKNHNGISLTVDIPGNITAEEWFEEDRWGKKVDGLPESIYCPHCGCCGRIRECPNRKPQPYHCGDCRKHFSVRIGTVMSHSPIPFDKWATALFLHVSHPTGINACQLALDLGVTHKTALFMLQRLRQGWPEQESLNSRALEVDEAFYGGNDKNRHPNKKFGRQWQKGVDIGVVAYCRETGRVAVEVIPDRKRKTLRPFVEQHRHPEGTLYTDEFRSYLGLSERHEVVKHNKGEYVRNRAHINGAESFNAQAKRTIRDTYRHTSPKYFHRYINEIAGRYNIRHLDPEEQMRYLTARMVRKRLTYRDLLATEVPPAPFTHHRSREGEPFQKVRKMTNPGVSY